MKDYNNELETILESKSFSIEVKNILLSMLYKVNTSYNDYSTVKRNVKEKKYYIEEILKTIEKCNEITLIKPSPNDDNKEIYNKFKVDKINQKIQVYPNEKTMLYAINELNSTRMYLNENYKLVKNSLPKLINKGKEINDTEVIRDFDAWTWNIQTNEIECLEANLIYQNMQLLLGYEKLSEVLNSKELKSDLEILEKSFRDLYGEDNANFFVNLVYKISIIISVNDDENERRRLLNERKWIEKEYNRLNNKNKLIEDISNGKKAILNKIKEIDIILNNKNLLTEEYQKRNAKLPDNSKIFSLSHFSEILLRERNKKFQEINEYNKLIEPINYTNIKSKFKKDLDLLSNIKLDGAVKNSTIKLMIKLQEIFLECFNMQINKANTKKEIIYYVYILRYYNYIPFSNTQYMQDVKELKIKILESENLLIEKMYYFKVINKNIDLNIIDAIFHTKIISLEDIQIEFKKENEKIKLVLYDEETIAETLDIDVNDIDTEKTKFNKKMKLFN